MKTQRYLNFIRERNHFNELLGQFPNVRACGVGVKFISGKPTEEPCLTVFVNKKIEYDQLAKNERLPDSIRVGRNKHLIDIVEIGTFIRQSAPENYPFGVCLNDQKENGTRSAFATTNNGTMALTCAHVISGADGDPTTPAPINSFNWVNREWLPYGISDHAVYVRGNNIPFDFGYLDAALVRLLPNIEPAPFSSAPLPCFTPQNIHDIYSLPGTTVNGFGIASGNCQGIVQAVLVSNIDGGGLAADVMITAVDADGLTKGGDSGLLWFDQQGVIIAQHILGEQSPPGKGSLRTIATFIHRIIDKLKIRSLH